MEREIDEAVAQLGALSTRQGMAPPAPAVEAEHPRQQLDAVEYLVARRRLPDDLVHFWTRWDVSTFQVVERTLGVTAFGPDRAVEWAEDMPDIPRILLPLAHSRYSDLCLELVAPDDAGGRLFDITTHGWPSHLVGEGVADLVAILVEAIALGHDPDGPRRPDSYVDLLRDKARGLGSVEDEAMRLWPRHWPVAEGFEADWLTLRGATHTIEELEAGEAPCSSVP